ncbi:MAG: LysR family transcriptional regulator [Myxococcales bacterium]|nr:LysR family transcriptional regulator [Myxococcales bacterium]
MEWDLLRHYLAVVREGSFTAAGRRLRVDPTTVARRVGRLEEELRTPLLIRNGPHVEPTPTGRRVAARAEEMERAQQSVRAVADDATGEPRGRVRVTTVQDVVDHLLLPALVDVSARWPELRVDLFTTHAQLDLASGQAELAVRVGAPTEQGLIARHLTTFVERPHVGRGWLEARGLRAEDVTDLEGREVLLLLADERWTAGFGRARPKLRGSHLATLVRAARRDLGIVMCPEGMGEGLVPLPALPIRRERALWLVTTSELASVPRVRVVMDAIVAAIT